MMQNSTVVLKKEIFRKSIYWGLILFILLDIAYSFTQHFHKSLDGDVMECVVPNPLYFKLFDSPFGYKAIIEKEKFPNPNRYFGHITYYKSFNHLPQFFQKFINPIDSVYLTSALLKTVIQLSILLLLAYFISGSSIFHFKNIIAMSIISPLFQTNGLYHHMGIIDHSISYVFFYAFPSIFLLIYFGILFNKYFHLKSSHNILIVYPLLIISGIISCFSGPLNPGIILIISLLIFTHYGYQQVKNLKHQNFYNYLLLLFKRIPKSFWKYYFPISIIALYSFYLGTYNINNDLYPMPLPDLYKKLPLGVKNQFFSNLGFPLLFAVIIVNLILINKKTEREISHPIVKISWYFLAFTIIYILLLPLGGYRDYRPNILRYDSIIPITLGIIILYGLTTLTLIKYFKGAQKYIYIGIIVSISVIYTLKDKPEFDSNKHEKEGLIKISNSKEKIVKLNCNQNVISWNIIKKPEDSYYQCILLKRWNIIKEHKLFYQEINNTNAP